MVILMNFGSLWKGWSEGKTDERIGIAVLRFSDEQILKDMENVIRTIEFYIWEYEKHTSSLSRGELEV
jgi:hypothetical protein